MEKKSRYTAVNARQDRNMNPLLRFLALLALLYGVGATAQDTPGDVEFRLFEDVENNTPEEQQRVRRQRNDRSNPTQPEFTLVGTSRIGDSYSAILKHRSGDPVYMRNLNPDGNNRIPGHTNYTLVDISAGTVSIRYPDSDPCVSFEEKGVSCSEAVNIAALRLANGEPINRPEAAESAGDAEVAVIEGDPESDAEDTPTNPFEALRAARANGDAPQAAETGRFTPRRIAPEDVPPGMRVVSTPFGDRLVQQ